MSLLLKLPLNTWSNLLYLSMIKKVYNDMAFVYKRTIPDLLLQNYLVLCQFGLLLCYSKIILFIIPLAYV